MALRRITNSNYQALTVEDLVELAVALTVDGAEPEYERAMAELIRDALALAGGPYIPDGPRLNTLVEIVTGRRNVEDDNS